MYNYIVSVCISMALKEKVRYSTIGIGTNSKSFIEMFKIVNCFVPQF